MHRRAVSQHLRGCSRFALRTPHKIHFACRSSPRPLSVAARPANKGMQHIERIEATRILLTITRSIRLPCMAVCKTTKANSPLAANMRALSSDELSPSPNRRASPKTTIALTVITLAMMPKTNPGSPPVRSGAAQSIEGD